MNTPVIYLELAITIAIAAVAIPIAIVGLLFGIPLGGLFWSLFTERGFPVLFVAVWAAVLLNAYLRDVIYTYYDLKE